MNTYDDAAQNAAYAHSALLALSVRLAQMGETTLLQQAHTLADQVGYLSKGVSDAAAAFSAREAALDRDVADSLEGLISARVLTSAEIAEVKRTGQSVDEPFDIKTMTLKRI